MTSMTDNSTNPMINEPKLPFGKHLHHANPDFTENQWKVRNIRAFGDCPLAGPDPLWKVRKLWHSKKAEDSDRLVLFKFGPFYEAFHKDADILCFHHNCIYMKGKFAHTGLVEKCWPEYKQSLDDKGFTYCIITREMADQFVASETADSSAPKHLI